MSIGISTFPSNVCANGYLNVYQEQRKENALIPIHQVLPMNFADEDQMSRTCTSFYSRCREALANGGIPEYVLGNDVLDVTGILDPSTLGEADPFTQWAIQFLQTFGESAWTLNLASVYCLYHLMRVCTIVLSLRFPAVEILNVIWYWR